MKTHSRAFSADGATVMAAATQAAQTLRWKITGEDPSGLLLSCSTRVSFASWGENVTISAAEGPHGTTLTIDVALRFGLFGWGIQDRRAAALLDEVGRLLGSQPPPPPPP